jgi:hypothetical protein
MHIDFERSGGVAGTRLTCAIEIQALPHQESTELFTIIDSAKFMELPKKLVAPRSGADMFHYKITVEMNERRHTVDIDEGAASPSLRPLLDWLTLKARQRQ